jgi:iron complex transport system ATP-binding protein
VEGSALRLEARGIAVGYHGKAVLSGIDLEIRSGELIAVVGPNGSGKTTLLKSLAGMTRPLAGSIYLDGKDLSSFKSDERARKLSFLSQGVSASWPFTVRELVSQGRFPHRGWFGPEASKDRSAVEQALDQAFLRGFEKRLVTELSGGELQRVLIARAIAQEPELLLLDEPVSQLDPKYQITIMSLVRGLTDGGLASVATMHDLNLASMYADRIALFAEGGLVALGPPREVLREDILKKAFGSLMVVGAHPDAPDLPAVYHPLPN